MWNVVATGEFERWFSALDERTREQVRHAVGLLSRGGPTLGRPWADTLCGSRHAHMKELRVRAGRLAIRIAFAFDPRRQAVLLAAGDKRGVSEALFYRRLIARADALYSQYLESR